MSRDIWSLLFTLKQSVTSRTYNNEADRIWDDRYDAWNSSASQAITFQMCNFLRWCSGWTLNIFFNRQEILNQKPCIRSPAFIKYFYLVLWCRFVFCRFGRACCFVHPARSPGLLIRATSPSEVDICDAKLKTDWSNPSKIIPSRCETLLSLVHRLTRLNNNFLGSGTNL